MPDRKILDSKGQKKGEDWEKEKWRFLHVGAHQLRSPVSTIHTQIKTILDGYVDDPAKIRLLLERTEHKTEDLLSIINDILKLALISEKGSDISDDVVDLEQLVTQVRESLEMKASNKGLQFNFNVPKTLPTVWVVRSYLHELFFNLIENAIKYTPSGGHVDVYINYSDEKREVEGYVKDTGIGIPKEFQAHLFEDFFRAPNAKSEEHEGSGLGLSVVKRVIDLYGGTISCETEVNQGTKFAFTLPLNLVEEWESKKHKEGLKKKPKRIVIIGGKAAGPKAAAKARRIDPNADITVIERERFLSYAGCGLPYYISGRVHNLAELMTTLDGDNRDPDFFRKVKSINVYNRSECTSIDREKKEIKVHLLKSGDIHRLHYDRLILATGSRPIIPPIEGIDLSNIYTLSKLEDAEGLRQALSRYKAGEVVVVGGGLIGMESAEAVVACGMRVTIVEACDQILPILDPELAMLVAQHFANHGVRIFTGESVVKFEGKNGRVSGVVTKKRRLDADIVIMSVGIVPEVDLARRAGLKIGKSGAIEVNDYLQTSDPAIFAIGDCIENTNLITGAKQYTPLGSIANKHGRIAGINAIKLRETFPGVVGTIIFKGCEFNVGVTGLTEGTAAKIPRFDPVSITVAGPDREHYYPNAKMIILKIVGDRKTEKLLGVQAVGPGDISKRIDIAATVLSMGGTVDSLSKLDIGYAPPYSTAMDIIISAANILRSKIYKRFRGMSSLQLHRKMEAGENFVLVDVRNPDEYKKEAIPGAISIPLRSLRGRLHELPHDREIILYCSVGINANEGARLLLSSGLENAYVLEGGIYSWPFKRV